MPFYPQATTRLDTKFRFYEIKRVFLACPGDLAAERSKFMRLLETVNNLRAHSLGFHLQAVGWERVIPSHGRPQSLINQELRTADLVVVLFWNRIGSPSSNTGDETGTVEEFNLARNQFQENGSPLVWVYFKKPTVSDDEQVQRVATFRASLEQGRDIFFREFSDTTEWEEMFREHLVAYLDGLTRWNVEDNFKSMDKRHAIMEGRFYGEGIFQFAGSVELAIDLDGDGMDEQVLFYHHHGAAELVISRFGGELRIGVPDNQKAEAEDIGRYHIALKDVNNDGLSEVLVAYRSSLGEVVVAIYGFTSESRQFVRGGFDLLAIVKGQYSAQVLDGGRIRLPYGSIGSAIVAEWRGDHFEEVHEERS